MRLSNAHQSRDCSFEIEVPLCQFPYCLAIAFILLFAKPFAFYRSESFCTATLGIIFLGVPFLPF